MKINLLRGSFTYGAVTIFSRIAAVVLIPILTRLLSPVEYGALNMALTIVTLANLVIVLEVAQAVTLYFSDSTRTDRDLYPATAIRFSLSMYLFVLLLAVLFGKALAGLINDSSIRPSLIVSGTFLLAANGLYAFLQNQFRIEFRIREYAMITLGYVLLTTIGAVTGALRAPYPAEGVLAGQGLGAVLIGFTGIIMLRKRFNTGFSLAKLREMLKFSLPLVPAGLLMLGGQQVPKFILSIYGNLEDVGIYGLAYQIAGFSALAVLGVQTAITPSVLANHGQPETPKTLATLFESFSVVAMLLCCSLSIFAHELVLIFSVPSYSRAADFVPALAFAIALINLYIFFPGKIIKGKSSSQLVASLGGFLVAVIAGLILVKYDGVRGAALATLLSAAAFFFIWCYISQRLYHLPVNWLKLSGIAFLTAVVCSVGIFFFPAEISAYSIVIKGCILLLFGYLVAGKYIYGWWKKLLAGRQAKNNSIE